MNLLSTGVRLTREQIVTLEQFGYTVTMLHEEADVAGVDVSEVEGLICNNVFQYRNVDDFERLRFVQAVSAGLDRLPLERQRFRCSTCGTQDASLHWRCPQCDSEPGSFLPVEE